MNTFNVMLCISSYHQTSGWIRNVTIRDSKLDGTNLAVRIKTMRGRGGGVEDVLYENLQGKVRAQRATCTC
jgi:polygalacturonase